MTPRMLDGPLAVLRGGPLDGWVYHVHELEQRNRSDAHFDRPARYQPTDKREPWAQDEAIYCQVWAYTR